MAGPKFLRRPRMRPITATLAMIAAAYVDRTLRFLLLIAAGWAAGPSELGVALLALLVTELIQTLTDLGVQRSLLQEKRLRRPTVDTAFALAMCNGAVIAAAMLALAGPMAAVMGEPRIEPLLRLLAVGPLANGLGQVPDALLQRRKRFRPIALRTIVATVLASGAGFGAIAGGSPGDPLILAAIVQACTVALLSWAMTPYRPRPRLIRTEWQAIGPRSLRLWMSGVIGFLNNRGFDFIAGLSLGPAALASLRIGGQIILLLIQITIGPILAIAYAVLPRLRSQPQRFRAELMIAAFLCSSLLFPAFAGLFALADIVLPVMLGAKWNDLAGILPFMCWIAPALYFQAIVSTALFGADRNDLLLKLSLFEFSATIILGFLGSRLGIVGIAAAGSLRLYMLIPVTWRWMRRTIGFDPKILLWMALPASISTMVMLGSIMLVKENLVLLTASYWAIAGGVCALGILIYSVVIVTITSAFAFFRIYFIGVVNNEIAKDLLVFMEVLTEKIGFLKRIRDRDGRVQV
ncbi:oligosaccharide flippase family protein [Methylobacterium sp. J-067]|uniref:oligosaccharide flippase family protein n=1 Tax=Methylobacterium sp. J-067 TaxID=2836648 RepID=UPI001FBA364D|nr:oligosaccharide flippase family protein [Methylobacterium sp. J-067]MCJ2024017.1 oligosaccharide flippase family protein [Methylobacterium sp. J-067]